MQQSDKIEVERLKLFNTGQNFSDLICCGFFKHLIKSCLEFCSTNKSNVKFGCFNILFNVIDQMLNLAAWLSCTAESWLGSAVHKYNLHNWRMLTQKSKQTKFEDSKLQNSATYA